MIITYGIYGCDLYIGLIQKTNINEIMGKFTIFY